jgi:hypothetical protein
MILEAILNWTSFQERCSARREDEDRRDPENRKTFLLIECKAPEVYEAEQTPSRINCLRLSSYPTIPRCELWSMVGEESVNAGNQTTGNRSFAVSPLQTL